MACWAAKLKKYGHADFLKTVGSGALAFPCYTLLSPSEDPLFDNENVKLASASMCHSQNCR